MSLERTALGCSGIMLPCSSASWSSGSFIGFRSAVAQFQRSAVENTKLYAHNRATKTTDGAN